MPRHPAYVPQGIISFVLLPFREDFTINENGFRRHLGGTLSRIFYADPWVNMHNRMKEALRLFRTTAARRRAAFTRRQAFSRRNRPHSDGLVEAGSLDRQEGCDAA